MRRIAGGLIVVTAMAMAATGCGSGSSSDANEPEASKTFLTSKGENKIPKFGEEASADEREAASDVLEENLKARAAAEWTKQCATLTVGAVKKIEENAALGGIEKSGCVKGLEFQGEPLSETKSIRSNTMTGPIDALRVKGDQGYALYHGTKGKDYAMRMSKEDDEWKVGAIVTTELE